MATLPNVNRMEEQRLVEAVKAGDLDAFRNLIRRYQRLVLSIIYKLTNRVEDREDLCQDVFLKVYEKIGAFRHEAKLSTWIGQIAYNHTVNFLKKQKNAVWHEFVSEENIDDPEKGFEHQPAAHDNRPLPDEMLMQKEMLAHLHEAVSRLNPVQRTVIELFHQQEFSLEEMATVMQLPVNTVKSHLFRARSLLKKDLQNRL